MNNKIKNAISIIENEKKCVQANCDRNCSKCKLVKEESEILEAFDTSLTLLKIYESVIEELKKEYDFWVMMAFEHKNDDFAEGHALAYNTIIQNMDQKIRQIE